MWSEKYRPKLPAELLGNEEVRVKFLRWLKEWKQGSAAMLVGPPGVGKTTLVHASARSLGYNVTELNASDVRTKKSMERLLAPLLTSSSLYGEKYLVLLDEVDGLHGRQDFGGVEYAQELAASGRFPVVMTANEEDSDNVRRLSTKAEVFRLRPLTPRLVQLYLKSIIKAEGMRIVEDIISRVVTQTRGDMRAAINTLQSLPKSQSVQIADLGVERDRSLPGRAAIADFLGASDEEGAFAALRDTSLPPQEKVERVFKSLISSSLEPAELAPSLESVSTCDEMLGRVGRTRGWRMLRYLDRFLAYGVYPQVRGRSITYSEEDLPWPLKLRIWNDSRSLRAIARKLGGFYHTSQREAAISMLSYFALICGKDADSYGLRMGLEEADRRVLRKEADTLAQAVR